MRYLLLLALAAPAWATVLFADDFADGDASGWMQLPGATYTVEAGMYRFTYTAAGEAIAASLNGDSGGGMSVPDCSIRAQCIPAEGQFGLMIRFSIFYFHGYAVIFSPDYDWAALVRIDGLYSDPVPIAMAPVALTAGQQYWMRLEASGSLLGARIWQGSPGDEPGTWLLLANDGSYLDAGSIGLLAMDADTAGTAVVDASFDDVEVVDDLTLDLDASTWARIKTEAGL